MIETGEILAAISTLQERGEPMALATIVSVSGSTYRRPGARLLVATHGDPIGNISGGCLEDDVARIGREVIASGEPRLVTFDLTGEGDAIWGYGMGCNGVIDVFIEPTRGAVQAAAVLGAGDDATMITVVESARAESPVGSRLVLWADGRREGGVGPAFEAAAHPGIVSVPGARAFVETVRAPLKLLVCGAGPDAVPLVRQAYELGWHVTVADVRRRLLTAVRFPGATAFVTGDDIGPEAGSYAVLMNHNYLRDAACLRTLLGCELAYLGVVGPRARTEKLLHELDAVDALPGLHAPAGLDLGAEGPEEVARSIVAEILAVQRGRGAGFLRDRQGAIHGDQPPM